MQARDSIVGCRWVIRNSAFPRIRKSFNILRAERMKWYTDLTKFPLSPSITIRDRYNDKIIKHQSLGKEYKIGIEFIFLTLKNLNNSNIYLYCKTERKSWRVKSERRSQVSTLAAFFLRAFHPISSLLLLLLFLAARYHRAKPRLRETKGCIGQVRREWAREKEEGENIAPTRVSLLSSAREEERMLQGGSPPLIYFSIWILLSCSVVTDPRSSSFSSSFLREGPPTATLLRHPRIPRVIIHGISGALIRTRIMDNRVFQRCTQ